MSSSSISNVWATNDGAGTSLSIADMVERTASQVAEEQALASYVYCEEYGMYYNYETGFYYDPTTSLFYNVASKQYYCYDKDTLSYKIYDSQDPPSVWSQSRFKRRANKLFGSASCSSFTADQVDVAEMLFELTEKCSISDRSTRKRTFASRNDDDTIFIEEVLSKESRADIEVNAYVSSTDDSDDDNNNDYSGEVIRRFLEEESSSEAPCIRLMEFVDGASTPTLHIITIVGGMIGFGDGADIRLSASHSFIPSSLNLIIIQYTRQNLQAGDDIDDAMDDDSNRDAKHIYEACMKASSMEQSNLTIRIALNQESLERDTTYQLFHNDVISVSIASDSEIVQYSLLIHLHNGLNTCASCEPGLYAQSTTASTSAMDSTSRRSRDTERRHIIRQIKKDYGINDDGSPPSCHDRFARRRLNEKNTEVQKRSAQNVGIYTRCLAAPKPGTSADSVVLQKNLKRNDLNGTLAAANNTPIQSQNKGFQLLKSMGWNEGKGLGKNQQGLPSPVELVSKTRFDDKNASLVDSLRQMGTDVTVDPKRKAMVEKMKERFEKTNEV